MPEREPKIFVLAPSWHRFTLWCRMDANPEQNPNDSKFVVIYPGVVRHRGYKKIEGDQILDFRGPGAEDLKLMGFTEEDFRRPLTL